MSFQINDFSDITALSRTSSPNFDNGLFRETVENAITERVDGASAANRALSPEPSANAITTRLGGASPFPSAANRALSLEPSSNTITTPSDGTSPSPSAANRSPSPEAPSNATTMPSDGTSPFSSAASRALSPEPSSNAITMPFGSASLLSSIDTGGAYVVASPKLGDKLKEQPDLAAELAAKITEMCRCHGESCRDNIVVVDRSGEITRYCPTHDKNNDYPTSEQLKELAKARARKKARLDAYFKLVERLSVKRKLIEQENSKHAFNKKYRYSTAKIDLIARSILQKPAKEPEYYI
ncbi:MAG: hypothetical protein NC299_06440 [Lachnospiraceae bacterium]|nr:hypothetical protein [Ruminococcus sp.]MCM1274993.1 hypothetical protein [Lachnospiraceae bacterium]